MRWFTKIIDSIFEVVLDFTCENRVRVNIHHVHPHIILWMVVDLLQFVLRKSSQTIVFLFKFSNQLVLRILIDLSFILDLLNLVSIH